MSNDFQINIKTTADTAGVEKTRNSLTQLKTALEAQVKAQRDAGVSAVQAELALQGVNLRIAELPKVAKPAAEKVEELDIKHKELIREMRMIGGPIGLEMGHGIIGASEGGMGAVIALTVAVKLLGEAFEETISKAAKLAVITWHNQIESLHKLVEELRAFDDAARKAGERDHRKDEEDKHRAGFTARMEAEKKRLKDRQEAEEKAAGNDPAKKEEIAKKYAFLNEIQDEGQARESFEQTAREIEERVRDQTHYRESFKTIQQTIKDIEDDPKKAEAELWLKSYEESGALDKLSGIGGPPIGLKGKTEQAQKEILALGHGDKEKGMEEARKRTQAAFYEPGGEGYREESYDPGGNETAMQSWQSSLDLVEKQERMEALVDPKLNGVARLQKRAMSIDEKHTSNAGEITKLNKKLDDDRDKYALGAAGHDVLKGMDIADRMKADQLAYSQLTTVAQQQQFKPSVSATDQEYMREVATMRAGKNVNIATAQAMFRAADANPEIEDKFLKELQDKYRHLAEMNDITFAGPLIAQQRRLHGLEGAGEPAFVKDAAAGAAAMVAGKQISDNQSREILQLLQLLQNTKENQTLMIQLIASANNSDTGLKQLMDTIAARIAELDAKITHGYNYHTGGSN